MSSKNKHETPKGWVEWLGYSRKPDLSKARTLGTFIGVFLTITVVGALSLATIEFFLAALKLGNYSQDTDGSSIRNTGLVLAALLGAPFVVWRTAVASKQVRIAEEVLFNDKMNAAVNGLSARKEVSNIVESDEGKIVLTTVEDDLVGRAASIDRLEGLLEERIEAAPRIVRLLATYVRGNFKKSSDTHTEPPFQSKTPRPDLQKAIDTIGRMHRRAIEIDPSNWRLDLKGCDFDGVNFGSGNFFAADFSDGRFEASSFREANLKGCLFRGSLLNFADFYGADLTGAKLDRITVNQSPGFLGYFGGAILRGVTFIGADISGVNFIGLPEKISETFGTKDTKVSPEIRHMMSDPALHDQAHNLRTLAANSELSDEEKAKIAKLEETGFQNWSPYDSSDMSTGWSLSKLYEELGMKKWPYW